jgi:hypothetical protein
MRSDKVYRIIAAAVFIGFVVIIAVKDWSWWVGVVILVFLIAGDLVLKYRAKNSRPYMAPQQPTYQSPPQPASIMVQGLVLPSAQRDYRFVLDVTVLWQPSGVQGVSHPRPDQLAIDAIRERATRLAEQESPADSDLLAPRLAAELSSPWPDRTGQLKVWAQNTILTIPDDDRRRLNKLAEVRKDEEVWDHERAHERNKRAYLREDVLSSTGSAVVWWLARNTARVQETVSLIETLAKLVAAAQDREVEPVFRTFVNNLTDPSPRAPSDDFVDRLMAEILPTGTEPERAGMADRLATLATEAGATDLAQTFRERFNAPDFTEPPEPGLFDAQETDPIQDTPVHPNGQAESGPAETPLDPPS